MAKPCPTCTPQEVLREVFQVQRFGVIYQAMGCSVPLPAVILRRMQSLKK
jgi:hypothetical protein